MTSSTVLFPMLRVRRAASLPPMMGAWVVVKVRVLGGRGVGGRSPWPRSLSTCRPMSRPARSATVGRSCVGRVCIPPRLWSGASCVTPAFWMAPTRGRRLVGLPRSRLSSPGYGARCR